MKYLEPEYKCSNPVVIIIFNRPSQVEKLIQILSKVQPSEIYVIADGARQLNEKDSLLVDQSRELISSINWDCQVHKNYSNINLGCKRRVVTGLDWVFSQVDAAIILEDDCLPTIEFFKYMDWGLDRFRDFSAIGMISGSNLVDYAFPLNYRNGFSNLINIWGWATWRRVWEKHNSYLALEDLNSFLSNMKRKNTMSWWRLLYWLQVFKHAVSSRTIWDFQLQYEFFSQGLISVYPAKNLVANTGFGDDATHTSGPPPDYWDKSFPDKSVSIMDFPENMEILTNQDRDNYNSKIIWSCTPLTAARLFIMNIIRYIKIY
jgi:hypothetical protein